MVTHTEIGLEAEKRRLELIVYGQPAPAGSKRGFYNQPARRVILTDDSKQSRPWKAQVADKAAAEMNGRELLDGPLAVTFKFVRPRPASHTGKRGLKPSAPTHPTTRPDVLKLARAVEDALTGIVWRDDAQIVLEVLTKAYGSPARVDITVERLPEREAA